MIIVIDGYNVLKGAIYPRKVTEQERNDFAHQLGKYAHKKKHSIVLVFDAGPYKWVHTDRINGVRVVYSGHNDSADDYIKKFIEDEQYNELLLVTTDRELCRFANKHEVVTIDSYDFYALLQDALDQHTVQYVDKNPDVVKISDNDDFDLDVLMMGASEHVPVKTEDLSQEIKNRIANNKTASRRDRKLMQMLKKL